MDSSVLGASPKLNLIIVSVLVILFLHHVKNLPNAYKLGLIIGNLFGLLFGIPVLGMSLVLTFFVLMMVNIVAFTLIGAHLNLESKRVTELEEQLVDALLILSGSLKAGRSLEQGFDLVQKSLPPPIQQEFFLVLQNQSLGMPFDKSLKTMLSRVPSKDFRLFVTATLFQRETGGNIISLYDQIIQATAERKQMRGKIDSLTVQGRYSAYMVAAVPVIVFIVMATVNPSFVGVFFDHPWAQSLFVLAIVLEITGILVIRGILDRKVA